MALPENYLPRNCTFSAEDWKALSRFWYPIAYADEVVAGKPFKTMLLDEELVVYRTSQGVVVAKDLCIHRGAPLSMGWMEGDEIVCAYHGFRYGPTGACTRVPAQPNAAIPRKLCLVKFHAAERYGLIWACLAETPVLPIPEWPIAEDASLKQMRLPAQDWNTSAARQVENFNDVAHLSWLHTDTFGNADKPEVEPYEVTADEDGLSFDIYYDFVSEKMRGEQLKTDRILYQYRLSFPFFTFLTVNFSDERHYFLFDLPSPVSRDRTRVFFKMAQDYDLDADEGPIIEFQESVLNEDRPMVESQRPEELPLDLTEEFHIRADRFSTYYRRALVGFGLGCSFTA